MINFIPQSAKKKIIAEYWVRVISVWLTSWSVALITGAFVLLPPYVLIDAQVSVYEKSASEAAEKVSDYNDVSVALMQANQEAKTLLDEIKLPVFSEYIELFEDLENSNLTITQIRINRVDEEISPIAVLGNSTDRKTLAAFRESLLNDDRVEEVDLPISNLASDSDIDFSLTVTLNNGNQE